jgi:hypothetical protein
MAHEFWKDSHVEFFHSYDPPPNGTTPYWLYFIVCNLCGVYMMNSVFFVPMKIFMDVWGPAPPVANDKSKKTK